MFGFLKKKETAPDKYCDYCSCELITVTQYIDEKYWHDMVVRPKIRYDTKTGVGTASRAEYLFCPSGLKLFMDNRTSWAFHYSKRIKDLEDEVFERGCK